MGWFEIPTPAQVSKNKHNHGATWEDLYGSWRCRNCGKPFKPGDKYYVVSNSEFEHVVCVENLSSFHHRWS